MGGPLRELTRRHPQISLSLREGTSRNLVAWLGQGLIDAAVISWFAADAVQRESTGAKWLAFPPPVLTLLMQPGHSLLKRGTVEVHALDHQPMVAYPRGTDVRTTVDSALAASAVVAETSFESSDTATLLAAVSAGLGSALIPMTGVAKNGVTTVPTLPQVIWRLGLAFHPGASWAPMLIDLLGILRRE